MKNRAVAGSLIGLMILSAVLSGCKKDRHEKVDTFGNTTEGIYVYADNCVQDVIFSDFDMTRYDAEEFRTFLQEEIDEYNASHDFVRQEPVYDEDGNVVSEPRCEEPIKVVECSAENDELQVQLLYATAGDYLQYMADEVEKRGGNTLQSGQLLYADASVTGASFIDTDGEALDLNEIITGKHAEEYRFVICNFEAVLYSEGEVAGYTAAGTYNADGECVSVPAGETVIVLYRDR